jgi:hypothetical protein
MKPLVLGAWPPTRTEGALEPWCSGEHEVTSSHDGQQRDVSIVDLRSMIRPPARALLLGRACSAASMKVCVEERDSLGA